MVEILSIKFTISTFPLLMGEPAIDIQCRGSNLIAAESAEWPSQNEIDDALAALTKSQLKRAKWCVIRGGELSMVPEWVNYLSERIKRPLVVITNGTLTLQYMELNPQPHILAILYKDENFDEIFEIDIF